MGLTDVDGKLFKLQATPPLEVNIATLEQTITEAELAGVEEFKLARARKKVGYATRVQAAARDTMNKAQELEAWRQEAEELHAITATFSYAALQNRHSLVTNAGIS
jgi:hypothetical protein